MDAAAARARLTILTAATSAPTLTTDELTALLALSQVADSADLPPTDTAWTPTWDLQRAAAEGWRWKASKVIGNFDFTADGATYNRAQVLAHCEKMVAQYQRRILGNVCAVSRLASTETTEDEET